MSRGFRICISLRNTCRTVRATGWLLFKPNPGEILKKKNRLHSYNPGHVLIMLGVYSNRGYLSGSVDRYQSIIISDDESRAERIYEPRPRTGKVSLYRFLLQRRKCKRKSWPGSEVNGQLMSRLSVDNWDSPKFLHPMQHSARSCIHTVREATYTTDELYLYLRNQVGRYLKKLWSYGELYGIMGDTAYFRR